MDRYAVIGNPVEHSRSPTIHHLFAEQTGQILEYGRVLAPLDGFTRTVQAFAAGGGKGCNVTIPFKQEAWSLAASRSPRAELAGAANTLRFDAAGWWADNTDGIGLVRDITRNAGVPLKGVRLLMVGAGGAAAGVLGPLIDAGVGELLLVNRTREKADALVASHAALARQRGVTLTSASLADLNGLTEGADERRTHGFDVLVNASASSLNAGAPPIPAGLLRPGALALDMMYGPAAQPFLAWAEAQGAVARDGLGMLVEQAAESFRDWRGVSPDTQPVLARLRAEVGGR